MNSDEIIRLLDQLGERLGPTGEYVFQLAVRQVILECASWLLMTVVLWVAFALTVRPLARWVQAGDSYSSRDMVAMLYVVGLGGSLVVFTFLSVIMAIPNLLNAEFVALEKLLDALP